jgi:hypothetical protein
MRSSYLAVTFILVLMLLWWLWAREIVVVRAIDTVPLFDPNSLAGTIGDSPKEVGQLKPGEELKVIACVDRKSDFNIHASYHGQTVAVGEWKGEIVLYRRHAYPWQQGAITSCLGMFEHVSKHA